MPHHVWSVLCYKVSIDQRDNLVSLLDVPEQITVQGPPGKEGEIERVRKEAAEAGADALIPVNLQLLSWWIRSDPEKPERAEARLRMLPPGKGAKLPPTPIPIDLSEKNSWRQRIVLGLLPFRGFGRYWFVIELRAGKSWRRMAKIPLNLVLGEPLPDKAVS